MIGLISHERALHTAVIRLFWSYINGYIGQI